MKIDLGRDDQEPLSTVADIEKETYIGVVNTCLSS